MTPKHKKHKHSFKVLLIFVITTLIALILYWSFSKQTKPVHQTIECDKIHFANAPIEPSSFLNDKNDIHLIHAEKNGVKPIFSSDDDFKNRIVNLENQSILVKLTDNKFYQLKSLNYSQPYLIPEAVDLLNEIGYLFQEKLTEKKYKIYKFRITSLLRTEEQQSKLSHRNSNATSHSAHLYGTTFDISYKNFVNTANDSIESSYEAVQTLTKVLIGMREQCKMLAVRERKQSCFHITVVVCKPINEP